MSNKGGDLVAKLSAELQAVTLIVGELIASQYADHPNPRDAIRRQATRVQAAIKGSPADANEQQWMGQRLELVVLAGMHALNKHPRR
jgi:hypothetical protein